MIRSQLTWLRGTERPLPASEARLLSDRQTGHVIPRTRCLAPFYHRLRWRPIEAATADNLKDLPTPGPATAEPVSSRTWET